MNRQPSGSSESPFAAYQEQLARGHEALTSGDRRAALKAYQAAAELADERPLPHVSVGRVLLSLNRPAEALAAFERALTRGPRDPAALTGKVEALLRLGRRDQAARAREELAAAEAEAAAGSELYLGGAALPRGEVLALAAERSWAAGRREAAIDAWLAAARAHAAERRIDAALDVCQRALLADAGAPQIHLEMSRLYLVGGLVDQARERMLLLGRLVELEPSPELRGELAALASQHAGRDPHIAELARRLAEPPPA